MEILKPKLSPPMANSINHHLLLFISRRSLKVSAIKVSCYDNKSKIRRTNHLRKKLILFQPQSQPQQVFSPPPPPSPPIVLISDEDDVVDLKPPPKTTSISVDLSWNQLQTWAHDQSLIPNPKQIYVFFAFLVLFSFKTFFFYLKQHQPSFSSSSNTDNQMLSRKFKARSAKQKPDSKLPPDVDMVKPQLDKQHLINTILTSNSFNHNSTDFDNKIQQIRVMTRNVRSNGEHNQSEAMEKEDDVTNLLNSQEQGISGYSNDDVPNNNQSVAQGLEDKMSSLIDSEKKPRIISSVKEAREYLLNKKLDNQEKAKVTDFHNDDTNMEVNTNAKKELSKASDANAGELGRANREKWMEDNFHEFEPIVEKIRGGFKNNYLVAKEKVEADINIVSELKMLERDNHESEFEWMKDEKLREIVFQVRENELMGRDPFYLMDAEDKALFFKGLENKVEKENKKLRELHEYVHSNIENLDYGADGISLYDPPEKIIPRWKGPPPATTMSQELLNDYLDQRKALFAETLGNSDLVKRDPQDSLHRTNEKSESKKLNSSKTVIEGSDGSIKAGKKSGKEFWQHTKKWSRGFLDSYNAESNPETKAVMKDIGKDLERWITEKEIQDAADIMDKVPDIGKKFIMEKLNRLKKEMELFGPQAVVSKYGEYGDDEEIDYYWWLDLPFLLCIELYITGDGDGEERMGFYSLEMASDLELDPKPHHIIAFEDAGDCKSLCYIIQAHLEMLGNGNAFVVPQTSKDTYREAKASGFNVTVIRKGELKLDVDQTLEEAEEHIVEIGSKIYHDKIMKGRNVDVDSVMKGVFGLKKPNKRRRSKKRLKKPT